MSVSVSDDDSTEKQCPLCMESLEIDDINFYPCKCEYQICSFCWHRLRTESNGLCPACRQAYSDKPVHFESVKAGKAKKEKPKTPIVKSEQTIRDLSTYRVLQMNLIYVTGLSPRIADVEILKKSEFFGQFGKILKLSISNGNGGSVNLTSACAYVTYSKGEEALRAILKFRNNTVIDGRSVKVSLGTTKYCASFLRNIPCPKSDCSYCHELADMEISFTAEDMQQGKHSEYEKRLLAQFEKKNAQQQGQAVVAQQMSPIAPIHVPPIAPIQVPSIAPIQVKPAAPTRTVQKVQPVAPTQVQPVTPIQVQPIASVQVPPSVPLRVVQPVQPIAPKQAPVGTPKPNHVTELQAGLRALLPNVNVRFLEVKDQPPPPFQPQSFPQPNNSIVDHMFEASLNRFFRSVDNSFNGGGNSRIFNSSTAAPPPGFSQHYR